MDSLAIGVILVLVLVYYFFLMKSKVAKVRLFKPKALIDLQNDDESTFQIAQVVLVNSDGVALGASDLTITGGRPCFGTNPATAFDGNTKVQDYPHVYSSCQKDYDNFLQAVLVTPQALNMIKVYNRSDCCASRLEGVVLETYDSSDKLLQSFTLPNKPIVTIDILNNNIVV